MYIYIYIHTVCLQIWLALLQFPTSRVALHSLGTSKCRFKWTARCRHDKSGMLSESLYSGWRTSPNGSLKTERFFRHMQSASGIHLSFAVQIVSRATQQLAISSVADANCFEQHALQWPGALRLGPQEWGNKKVTEVADWSLWRCDLLAGRTTSAWHMSRGNELQFSLA